MIDQQAKPDSLTARGSDRPAGRPTVAVIQSTPALGDVERNLDAALASITSLAGHADLVVLPELFTTGYSLDLLDLPALAEPLPDGPTARRLSQAASEGIAIVGAILERDGDTVYDTAVVFDTSGRLVTRYRKSHLHPTEERCFGEGDRLVVVPLDAGIRLGLAICFEHGFPELFAELALRGANVIAIPSAVPDGFDYLLDLRTRARAQDNQVFVLAANLGGNDGVTSWCGGSAIVDPRGELLAVAPTDREAQLVAEIDLTRVDAERQQEPLFLRRRPELYARLRTRGAPPAATVPSGDAVPDPEPSD